MYGTAIIGAGNMGRTRARVIQQSANSRVVFVADSDPERAKDLAKSTDSEAALDWDFCVQDPRVDIAIICTPTTFHAPQIISAVGAGKHVLCEKPLARSSTEALTIAEAAERSGCVVKTGFNYRYLDHVHKAKELLADGAIGPAYFLRCRYGHGGRPGYEKHWCTDRELSGGGVLLEQGIHIVDLVRYLLGEPATVFGAMQRYFWNFSVEDNCFLLIETETRQTAEIHVSWTQWRNLFSLEIFGRDGSLELTGRDGYYGPPKLVWSKRRPDHGRPEETVFEYSGENLSWEREWADFLAAIESRQQPMSNITESLRALQIVDAAYQSSGEHRWVNIPSSVELIESTS